MSDAGEALRSRVSRRRFLGGLGVAGLALARPASAERRCWVRPGGAPTCISEVKFPTFAAIYDRQHQSQWCWAASIAMLFRYYGFPVSQQRIVSDAYGAPVNVPAGAGFVIAQQLNRHWIDDRGRRFRSQLRAAFDADAGVSTLDNAAVVRALDDGHPLIVGARSHAMVLTAAEHQPGPRILRLGVFDPWPRRGARGLSADEMVPMPRGGSLRFLALAEVRGV